MDNRDYKQMENVLITINSKHIALPDAQIKRNNGILNQLLQLIVNRMKQIDPLFSELHKENYYGGSYYDKLKVGQPNEYDLDFILKLPEVISPSVECSNLPGFLKVRIADLSKLMSRPEEQRKRFEKLRELMDSANYLSTIAVFNWVSRVLNLTLKDFCNDHNTICIDMVLDKNKPEEKIQLTVTVSSRAPAYTLKLFGIDLDGSPIQMDVDLVPCFQFTQNDWPAKSAGYRPNTTSKDTFLVVPKKPKVNGKQNLSSNLESYWRLSFQEQERSLITSEKSKNLKPALRLLKKLRDQQKHNIASYFIKTIFLSTLEEELPTFWIQPLSNVFMEMLRKYANKVREGNIPYYWNSRYNLIESLKESNKTDLGNRLNKILQDVNNNFSTDPFVIGKYLLSSPELEKLKNDVQLGKKNEKNINKATAIMAIQKGDPTNVLNSEENQELKEFSEAYEEQHKQEQKAVDIQIESHKEIIKYFADTNEKLDKILDILSAQDENQKFIMNKIGNLEERVEAIGLETKDLSRKLNESNNSNHIKTLYSLVLGCQDDEDNNETEKVSGK